MRKQPFSHHRDIYIIAILSLLILGLSATICYIYQQRNQAQEEEEEEDNLLQEQTLDGDSVHSKANQVMDYQLWNH